MSPMDLRSMLRSSDSTAFATVQGSPSSDKAEWIMIKAFNWSIPPRDQPLVLRISSTASAALLELSSSPSIATAFASVHSTIEIFCLGFVAILAAQVFCFLSFFFSSWFRDIIHRALGHPDIIFGQWFMGFGPFANASSVGYSLFWSPISKVQQHQHPHKKKNVCIFVRGRKVVGMKLNQFHLFGG